MRIADPHVASHAIAVDAGHVRAMIEFQMLAGEVGPVAYERFAVAIRAIARVVRLRVATNASRGGRKMDRRIAPRRSDPGMTGDAAHAVIDVGAMLERMRRRRAMKPEDARARGKRKREHHHEG